MMNIEKNSSDLGKKASLKRLQFCNFKLDFLLNLTLAINENLPVNKILEKFLSILKEDLNIGKVLLFNYNEKWERLLISGVPHKVADEIKVPNDLIYYNQITNLTIALNPHLTFFDVLVPVFHHERPIAYLLIGDIEEERAGMSPTIKHLHFIQTLTNIVVVAIENRNLYNQNLRQEVLKKELDLASRMQSMLIPSHSSLPNNSDFNAAAYYLPHFEVGGDYYDVIQLNDHQYGFCIADVSGKGISAALLMSNFQANVRALFTANRNLEEIVHELNQRVMNNANGEKFITLFIGEYNSHTKKLTYINAGHNPPVFYQASTKTIKILPTGCIGVGMLDFIPTLSVGVEFTTPGSRLIMFTDGTVELENEKQEEFGTGIMEHELMQTQNLEAVIDKLVEELESFRGNGSYADDITLLALEFSS
jgi:sigma-B regulation protein RsbU (phosphoserine phosphatase)